jgi:hypothetical protein
VVELTENDVEDNSKFLRETIKLAYSSKVVKHGTMLYVAIRDVDARFWDLLPGDRVLMEINTVLKKKRPIFVGDSSL